MKNGQWYAALFLIASLAASGAAFAHDRDGHGHHMMCEKDGATCKKMHALHEKMHAVLSAEKFDKKQFLALSGQMEKIRSEMMRKHIEAFADKAEKMTPEERQDMMHHMFHEHGGEGWKGHKEHRSAHDSFSHLNN